MNKSPKRKKVKMRKGALVVQNDIIGPLFSDTHDLKYGGLVEKTEYCHSLLRERLYCHACMNENFTMESILGYSFLMKCSHCGTNAGIVKPNKLTEL